MSTTTRTRGARTALIVGSALAAPMAAVGIAGALTSPTPGAAGGTPSPAPAGGTVADEPVIDERDVAAAQAFWDAGYQYCDAAALAEAGGTDIWEAKVATGAALVAGGPVAPPSGCMDDVDAAAEPLNAFWAAGYGYCDAEALAAAVGAGDPYEAKVAIGTALLTGHPAPAPTGCAA